MPLLPSDKPTLTIIERDDGVRIRWDEPRPEIAITPERLKFEIERQVGSGGKVCRIDQRTTRRAMPLDRAELVLVILAAVVVAVTLACIV